MIIGQISSRHDRQVMIDGLPSKKTVASNDKEMIWNQMKILGSEKLCAALPNFIDVGATV